MKKYIKSSLSAYSWWNQYYNDISIEDACEETNQTPEELIAQYQKAADAYDYTFRGLLEAKPEYADSVDDLWCLSKYTDKDGNIDICHLVDGRLYSVTQEDVIDKMLTEPDEGEIEEDPLKSYEDQGFYKWQLDQIKEGLRSGVDVSIYADPKFEFRQMREIRLGLEEGLDVSLYADPKFESGQMLVIRRGLEDGLDVSVYADPQFNWSQMNEIRKGLESGVDVSTYADPKYHFEEMELKRSKLEFDKFGKRYQHTWPR